MFHDIKNNHNEERKKSSAHISVSISMQRDPAVSATNPAVPEPQAGSAEPTSVSRERDGDAETCVTSLAWRVSAMRVMKEMEREGNALSLCVRLSRTECLYTHTWCTNTCKYTHTYSRCVCVSVHNVRKRESVIMTVYLSGTMQKIYSTYTKQTF